MFAPERKEPPPVSRSRGWFLSLCLALAALPEQGRSSMTKARGLLEVERFLNVFLIGQVVSVPDVVHVVLIPTLGTLFIGGFVLGVLATVVEELTGALLRVQLFQLVTEERVEGVD